MGTGSVSFSLVGGTLPSGMTLSSTGLVSDVPTMAAVFDFTVRATDTTGKFGEQIFVIRVLQPIVPPADAVAWWRGQWTPSRVVCWRVVMGMPLISVESVVRFINFSGLTKLSTTTFTDGCPSPRSMIQ